MQEHERTTLAASVGLLVGRCGMAIATAAIVSASLVAADLALAQASRPSFTVSYERPSQETVAYAALIRESGVFDDVVADLNAMFALPAAVHIRFLSAPNVGGPQYGGGEILMPYEFLAENDLLMDHMGYSETPEDQDAALLMLAEFVTHHEVGHALIDILGLPVLGREEDAVDQLAAIVAAYLELGEIALVASDVFAMGAELSDEIHESEFWDTHSLSEQRMFNIACLLYGSDPQTHDGLLQEFGMPAEEGPRCAQDYVQASESWVSVLGPALLVE